MRSQKQRHLQSMIVPMLLAQAVDQRSFSGWLIIGGACAVLGVGVVIVVLARPRKRLHDLDDRIAARAEASSLAQPPPNLQPPAARRPSGPTFVDLPRDPLEHIDLRNHPAPAAEPRRSPLSSHLDDVDQKQTFVDLPGSQIESDPVIDLTDESIDLTEEREEASPKGDPWS